MLQLLSLLALLGPSAAHETQKQTPISGPHNGLWYNALPGDGGIQVSLGGLEEETTALTRTRLTPSSLASPRSVVCSTILA